MIDYSTLNPEQHQAVFSEQPQILCLAGAGTGKTQVLTRRIARLWESGISPQNMLALTFTRAAGAEMKERVISLIGADGKELFCNTFHAFCVDVIRTFATELGYEPNFSVYDQPECDELLTEVLTSLKYKIPVKRVADFRAGRIDNMTSTDQRQAERAIKEYEFRLRRNNAFDFDGLIKTVKTAVYEREGIRTYLQQKYKHIFVDEFQDTDGEQWSIVQGTKPANVFVVGDDFQSIYGFRGSDITIILGLAENAEWHTVKLERNYRSSLPIVTAANALIKYNHQTQKNLVTEKEGVKVECRRPSDDAAEITAILPRLEANQSLGISKTTAILARTNKQLERAKDLLTANNIRCETLSSADNPFAGKGAKELIAWIAALENPLDDAAVRRIATIRASKKALLDAEWTQVQDNIPLLEALKVTKEAEQFMATLDLVNERFHANANISEGANRIATALKIDDRGARYEIVKWHQRQIDLGEPETAAALLEWVRLGNVAERPDKERDASKVYLMTVHGSKGLEFDEVFIIGASQGTFPNRGDLEEERRLFYVAITRARDYLNISSPNAMTGWNGKVQAVQRSQFISEARLLF